MLMNSDSAAYRPPRAGSGVAGVTARDISIVSAWKDMGDPARLASYRWTRDYWRRVFPDAELVEAAPEPFTRAAGLNAAIRKASHDLILQADPDTIVPDAQAHTALQLAAEADGLVVPYDRYLYLDKAATQSLHAGYALDYFSERDCEDFGKNGAGPVTAFSRRTWETVGGYDERFGLWGGDDAAFQYACAAYIGPERRVEGPALHSWHPRLPESVPGGEGYVAGFALLAEYRDAAAEGPDAVKFMVEGGRRTVEAGDGWTWGG